MKNNRFNYLILIVGAIMLAGASSVNASLNDEKTVWFKIIGLILLMLGIFRVYRQNQKSEDGHDRGR